MRYSLRRSLALRFGDIGLNALPRLLSALLVREHERIFQLASFRGGSHFVVLRRATLAYHRIVATTLGPLLVDAILGVLRDLVVVLFLLRRRDLRTLLVEFILHADVFAERPAILQRLFHERFEIIRHRRAVEP